MTAQVGWLLQNAFLATLAALLFAGFARRLPGRIEVLLWVGITVKFLAPPVVSAPLPTLRGDSMWDWASVASRTGPEANTLPAGPTIVADESPVTRRETGTATSAGSPGQANTDLGWLAGSMLLWIWLAGAGVTFAAQMWRTIRFRAGKVDPPADASIQSIVRQIADAVDMRAPSVVVAQDLTVPVVTGLLRPRLLLPSTIGEALEPDALQAVIAHELAHIQRGDLWLGLIELAGRSVWWWYPGWHFAQRRLRDSMERACDERVLALMPASRKAYAEGLVTVAAGATRPALALRLDGAAAIERRVRHILRRSSPRRYVGAAAAGALLLLAITPAWRGPEASGVPDFGALPTGEAVLAEEPGAEADATLAAPHDGDVVQQPVQSAAETAPRGRPASPPVVQTSGSQLARRLRSDDAQSRRRAVAEIGRQRIRSALPLVLPLSADPDRWVRWQVATTIGMVEDTLGIPTLIGQLDDDWHRVRESAAWALGTFPLARLESDTAVAPLLHLASDPHAGVRRQMAATFGIVESSKAAPALVRLLGDPDSAVRRAAEWAIGELSDADIAVELLALAADQHHTPKE